VRAWETKTFGETLPIEGEKPPLLDAPPVVDAPPRRGLRGERGSGWLATAAFACITRDMPEVPPAVALNEYANGVTFKRGVEGAGATAGAIEKEPKAAAPSTGAPESKSSLKNPRWRGF